MDNAQTLAYKHQEEKASVSNQLMQKKKRKKKILVDKTHVLWKTGKSKKKISIKE